MDRKKAALLTVLILPFTILAACNTAAPLANRQASLLNRNHADNFSPFRYEVSEAPRGGYLIAPVWAGVPGPSITNLSPQVQHDAFAAIENGCGHSRDNIHEVRLVSKSDYTFNEVWLYQDPQSKRKDGLSGLSILFTQLPDGGGVDMQFYGPCHADAGPVFIFN